MRRLILVLALLAVVGGASYAGQKLAYPVVIGSNYAYGTLGTARNSADANQLIGCWAYSSRGQAPFMDCSARNSAGTYVVCSSTDPDFVAQARSVKGDSYVYFSWDSTGTCISLDVEHFSSWEPKQP
jgi:hypothetical protein